MFFVETTQNMGVLGTEREVTMKAIILAAGQGTRLAPYTNDRPKCLVEYNQKPILSYILDALNQCNVVNITIVGGYKSDVLQDYIHNKNICYAENRHYASTNMVETLFCALNQDECDDDIIISYADIIYQPAILRKLIDCEADLSVVIDRDWLDLWQCRMDDPLCDAETLKLDKEGYILELGKKPLSYADIEGQYIGLIKIKKSMLRAIIKFYDGLPRNSLYDGQNFQNMYMTSFLQLIINNVEKIKAVPIHGGWLEIDTVSDLNAYNKHSGNTCEFITQV